jgi:hypothetical protein
LILVWPIAAKAPSAIEPTEMAMTICFQSPAAAGKASITTRISMAKAATFGPAAR